MAHGLDWYPNSRDEQLHMVKTMEHRLCNPRTGVGYPPEPHHPTGKRRSGGGNHFEQGEKRGTHRRGCSSVVTVHRYKL